MGEDPVDLLQLIWESATWQEVQRRLAQSQQRREGAQHQTAWLTRPRRHQP